MDEDEIEELVDSRVDERIDGWMEPRASWTTAFVVIAIIAGLAFCFR